LSRSAGEIRFRIRSAPPLQRLALLARPTLQTMNDPFKNPLPEYLVDAAQRMVLLLDTLRQRGNRSREQEEKDAPHVLEFEFEHILDGKTLPRPTNYQLVRIIPPEGTRLDPSKPPFVVVDPRAGHGPGIGGMKHDSEIGAALAAGHACYFVGFLREPVPGQTVEDVCQTEARFLEEVIARHPEADGKPVVIANCQAGWQIMMMAALRPELTGPLLLVGSPLSYWAGVRGKNPLRYLGGLLGGTWLTALAGDMGAGRFDGANLIANFESMNPGNTYWKKLYNLYSRIDEEAPRYLEFETWWGTPVVMNAEEMQWIADELFLGNKLSTGQLRTSNGTRIDLRNVTSPIIVFCSWGDDITPPQQALGWITDLYDHESEIVAAGQTIVYTMHDSIGHLGIFVSGKVANKEHTEFARCMEMIDLMPPGLYEAVITEVSPGTKESGVTDDKYLLRLETRTLDDIRKLGVNPPEDERRFATVARVSEVNKSLYRTFASPLVRALFPESVAKAVRQLHPNRFRFSVFSDRNPLLRPVKALADAVRANRKPASPDNPLFSLERAASSGMTSALDGWGTMRGRLQEAIFLAVYGHPAVQALAGFGPGSSERRHAERDLAREVAQERSRFELSSRYEHGGFLEAVARALVYIRIPEGRVDERGFAMVAALRAEAPPGEHRTWTELKQMLKEQFFLVRLDEERALQTLPAILPSNPEERRRGLELIRRMLAAEDALSGEGARRLQRIESLFEPSPRLTANGSAPAKADGNGDAGFASHP
jgi:pimeloyl-ACP methyl ester carboxylesterase